MAGDEPSAKKAKVDLQNLALVFIKPHAQLPAVQALVRQKLESSKIRIWSEGTISGEDIDKKKLIDQHYYAIASKATLLTPDQLPVPAEKFQEKFGVSWSDTLASGKAVNAMQAADAFGLDAIALTATFRKAEAAGNSIKFGGGFYCGKLEHNEKTLFVFNPFFMAMRNEYVKPNASIYYFWVSWNPQDLSWTDFRGKVLGPTKPVDGPAGSLRRSILEQWKELGLQSIPKGSDNGLHASASPFEALAERTNWLGTPIGHDKFGSRLLSFLSEDRIKLWSRDAQIRLSEDDSTGSIFDAVEDLDVEACLDKLQELNRMNK